MCGEKMSLVQPALCFPDKLTSSVYGPENPPKDWADVSFLIPHEGFRHGIDAMLKSVDKLATGDFEPWQAVYFCEWFVESFVPGVEDHHTNEEAIYFPWVTSRAKLPDKLSKGHEELIDMMKELSRMCETVIAKEGKPDECKSSLVEIQPKMKGFAAFFQEHIAEEELTIPPLLRANFTKEEEGEIVQKIIQKEGLSGMRCNFPAIAMAMEQWATASFYDEFMEALPGPIHHLAFTYFIPDEKTNVIPKRDAPLLSEKPKLSRVSCCGIPGCFPCLI